MFCITTNGTLYFNKEVQDFLKKYINFLSFSITIDGNKELHDSCRVFPNGKGSYDLAIAAARHFKSTFHRTLGTKMTVSPTNVYFIKDAIINLINENYSCIFINCCYEKGWDYSHAYILYNQLKQLANYLISNNLLNIYISMF